MKIGKGKLAGIIAGAVLVVGLVTFFTVRYFTQSDETADGGSGVVLRLDDDAVPYSGSEPEDRSDGTQGIKIPGYTSIDFSAGSTEVNVSLLNPEGNPCYFTFELVLDDTGESLYLSDMVEPSMCIEQITLARALDAGEYPATIQIRTYSLESLTELNNADVKTTLKVT